MSLSKVLIISLRDNSNFGFTKTPWSYISIEFSADTTTEEIFSKFPSKLLIEDDEFKEDKTFSKDQIKSLLLAAKFIFFKVFGFSPLGIENHYSTSYNDFDINFNIETSTLDRSRRSYIDFTTSFKIFISDEFIKGVDAADLARIAAINSPQNDSYDLLFYELFEGRENVDEKEAAGMTTDEYYISKVAKSYYGEEFVAIKSKKISDFIKKKYISKLGRKGSIIL